MSSWSVESRGIASGWMTKYRVVPGAALSVMIELMSSFVPATFSHPRGVWSAASTCAGTPSSLSRRCRAATFCTSRMVTATLPSGCLVTVYAASRACVMAGTPPGTRPSTASAVPPAIATVPARAASMRRARRARPRRSNLASAMGLCPQQA